MTLKKITIVFAAMIMMPKSAGALVVDEFLSAITGDDSQLAENYIWYANGVIDTTMNMGLHLGLWCFPNPMPTREYLFKEYLVDLGHLSLEFGEKKALQMELDQALLNRWGRKYSCARKTLEN